MNPLLQKLLRVSDPREVGEVVQSPINLEAMTGGRYLLLDGRDLNRADVPELGYKKDRVTGALAFPGGVFTGTARTLAASPAQPVIAVNGNGQYVAAAANSGGTASMIQASSDGVTWSTDAAGGWAGGDCTSLIYAGSRLIMTGSSGSLVVPHVSSFAGSDTAATAFANWTATTVATTTTLTQGLAYSATANAGAGRAVMIPNAAGTTIWTLDDGATAWVARSHSNSRTKKAVVCTGTKFIAFCTDNYNIILTSNDGVTWVEQFLPQVFSSAFANAVSDGRGTVVAASTSLSGIFIVSKDHGATWRTVYTPYAETLLLSNASGGAVGLLSVANDKFFCTTPLSGTSLGNDFVSADGTTWFAEPLQRGRGVIYAGGNTAKPVAYKNGVYCLLTSATTAALTLTEDTSKFRLPLSGWLENHSSYIKARSY